MQFQVFHNAYGVHALYSVVQFQVLIKINFKPSYICTYYICNDMPFFQTSYIQSVNIGTISRFVTGIFGIIHCMLTRKKTFIYCNLLVYKF